MLILLGILLYVISFGVFMKVPQGMRSMTSMTVPRGTRPATVGPGAQSAMLIYASRQSVTMNRIGKVVYYPLVRLGEAMGWWWFVDDARQDKSDAPCLMLYLLYQLYQLLWMENPGQ